MRFEFPILVLFAALTAVAAPPWEDPAVNAENRLEARAYLPPEAPFVKSLNFEGQQLFKSLRPQ